jgi:hypothetical protein
VEVEHALIARSWSADGWRASWTPSTSRPSRPLRRKAHGPGVTRDRPPQPLHGPPEAEPAPPVHGPTTLACWPTDMPRPWPAQLAIDDPGLTGSNHESPHHEHRGSAGPLWIHESRPSSPRTQRRRPSSKKFLGPSRRHRDHPSVLTRRHDGDGNGSVPRSVPTRLHQTCRLHAHRAWKATQQVGWLPTPVDGNR